MRQTTNISPRKELFFLEGGGEMGELTRQFDWTTTLVGSPENWPQVLRTTLSMILSSRFPMFLWWGDDLIQFYNDAYRPSLGNEGKHPRALGQKAIDCWPEIWNIIYPLIEQVKTTGQATWSEDQLVPIFRNGKIEDVYWTFGYSAIRNEQGTIEGVLVVCNETTAKVQTMKKLVESQKRFHTLISEATVGIIVLMGEQLVAEIVNRAYAALINCRYEDIVGRPIFDVVPETEAHFRPIIESVLFTGEPVFLYAQHYLVKANGNPKEGFLNLAYKPYKEEDGHISGVMILCQDVTEEVMAKNSIEQSEANLRNTILKAPVAMCILTGAGFIVDIANERMIELWGKTAAAVIGKPLFEGLPEARYQGFEELLERVYVTGDTISADTAAVQLPRVSGIETVYVNFVYQAYRQANGKIVGVIAVATEVTELVTAKLKIENIVTARTRELAAANSTLQRTNEELAQFAYIASHDLQEPLRKVSNFSQLLERSLGPHNDKSAHYLAKINTSVARMIALVRDVLSFSQLSHRSNVFEAVDLNMVVEGILTDFELLIEEKDAIITYTHLPTIEAIPVEMRQLLGNLISNSLKFSKAGNPPQIDIRCIAATASDMMLHLPDKNGRYYKITVTDNGIGFDQAQNGKIFQIFQRLHGQNEYAGTGIGLAMCKKIVQKHHGHISAISSENTGATFYMLLPAEQPK